MVVKNITNYTINISHILYKNYNRYIRRYVVIPYNMITDKNDNDNSIENENIILKNQVCFLMECIKNQMTNLKILCDSTKTNFIHKEQLKPYYEKVYKCNIYI